MITANNKFEVGQKVIYLDSETKPQEGEVECVSVHQYNHRQNIVYSIKGKAYPLCNENELFASREDLYHHVFGEDLLDFV